MLVEVKKSEVRGLGLWDTARFHATVTLHRLLWGFVAARPLFVPMLVRLNAGQWVVRTFDALRQKHNCDLFWVLFPGARTLIALDGESMDVLLESSQNQADPSLKKKALSKFIPDALTISTGEQWQDRRKFNEQALDFGRLHRHADAFAQIVAAEVEQLPVPSHASELRWADFQRLAQRISEQVLLGPGELSSELMTQLSPMVMRSNCPLLPRDRAHFSTFYQNLERHLHRYRHDSENPSSAQASKRCLMHDSAKLLADGSATAATRVPTQIGFWMFVMKDALELHVARTLALIASHPQAQDRVQEVLEGKRTMTAEMIYGLQYLNACVREQLRLWTPVPMLLRRATQRFPLQRKIDMEPKQRIDVAEAEKVYVKAGQQILLYPGFYHRDPRVFGHIVDQFSPDSVTERLPTVYYFSRGRQECAGQNLVLFLIQATLAALLARFRFELIAPPVDTARVPYLYDHFHVEFRVTAHRLVGSDHGRSSTTVRR